MVDLISPIADMSPDIGEEDRDVGGALGTPPGSPYRNSGNFRSLSSGKEEEAADTLLRLATPSKSPHSTYHYKNDFTPGGGPRSNGHGLSNGVELTPVSRMFTSTIQSPENDGGHTPLPNFLSSVSFSPGNLSFFSPQGKLDFPPGSPVTRAPWQPVTPDVLQDEEGRGKKMGKPLFTDGRLQDPTTTLGAWCLGTPDKTCAMPSTPNRMLETPKVEAPGDDAAGILMGLRSPGFSSPGDNKFMKQLFMDPLESSDANKTINTQVNGLGSRTVAGERIGTPGAVTPGGGGGKGRGRGGGGLLSRRVGGVADSPNTTPIKRHRTWASPSGSPRNSHCKVSFTIEGKTLIRSNSMSNGGTGGGGGMPGSGGGGKGRTSKGRGGPGGPPVTSSMTGSPSKPVLISTSSLPGFGKVFSASSSTIPGTPNTPAVNRTAIIPKSGGGEARGMRGEGKVHGSRVSVPAMLTPSTSIKDGEGGEGTPVLPRVKPQPEVLSFYSPEQTQHGSNTFAVSVSPAPDQVSGRQHLQQQQEQSQVGGAPPPLPHLVQQDALASTSRAVTCNCKKSRCLKLYCECFQRRLYCSDCNCHDCLNTSYTEEWRQIAIQATIERNPNAFSSKFDKQSSTGRRSHNAGCNCKKSACLKKYCECFQAGAACGAKCKCSNCKNYEGSSVRKRRLREAAPPPTHTPLRGQGGAGGEKGGEADEEATAAAANLAMVRTVGSPARIQVGGEDDSLEFLHDTPGPITTKSMMDTNAGATRTVTSCGKRLVAATPGLPMVKGVIGGKSPASEAIADQAIARSLLDMGSGQVQTEKEDEDGFVLRMVTHDLAHDDEARTLGGGGGRGGHGMGPGRRVRSGYLYRQNSGTKTSGGERSSPGGVNVDVGEEGNGEGASRQVPGTAAMYGGMVNIKPKLGNVLSPSPGVVGVPSGNRSDSGATGLGVPLVEDRRRVRRSSILLQGLDTYCRPFGKHFTGAMNKSSMITALSFLDNDDLYNSCLVSKGWVKLAMDDALWED